MAAFITTRKLVAVIIAAMTWIWVASSLSRDKRISYLRCYWHAYFLKGGGLFS